MLPWPSFWASTKPFGTPLGPYAVKWGLTVLMILAPPAGDAFNFSKSTSQDEAIEEAYLFQVVDIYSYPSAFFNVMMAIGIYLIRWRRSKAGLPRGQFTAWDVAVIFNLLSNLYLLIMPWYPPAAGRYGGDVSFWYATYVVVGIGM